ncbi:putative cell wall surface anchor family protein [Secundilactobacillus oryzae JCM 18671]|uniref:Putative cell wall surface anchor family protein n=1 Tax=Secundilactobacillus oryzae JCM 18671 TaxID=1291743 RepID=A0A081BIF0_9LACO|nr:MucBP domain-containing protein [Secundilactobacillus oryzae]GAK47818.1 putative cell wall surface anchor family protein [Secundilactobacillus oryzae JCM 18671]
MTDWSQIKAFRFVLSDDGQTTVAGQNQTISFQVKVPDKATLQDIDQPQVWNTFALAANSSQVVEPAQVGILVTLAAKPVQVIYQTEDGTQLGTAEATYPEGMDYGNPYETEQKTFDGYTFVTMGVGSAAADGTLTGEAQTVIYVYRTTNNGGGNGGGTGTTPEQPGNPGTPEQPGTPELPETPEQPGQPTTPELPTNPENPAEAGKPGGVETGTGTANTATLETSTQAQNQNTQLPQTEEKQSVSGITGLIMLAFTAVMGLVGSKKRKE